MIRALTGNRQALAGALLLLLSPSSVAVAAVLVPPRASVVENRGEIRITLERSAGVAGELELQLRTGGGTATPGEDFTPTSTTLFWGSGEGGLRDFVVPILDDRRLERNESFAVTVEVLRGPDRLNTSRIRVLIEEDDFRRLAERRLSTVGDDPRVAVEPGGRRLILFTTPFGVFASFVSPAGQPLGDPFPIRQNAGLGAIVDAPAVAAGRSGRFFVAWRVFQPGEQTSRIEGRAFDRGGAPLGPVVGLSDDFLGLAGPPRVAVGNRGQIVVLFADPDGLLVGRVGSAAEAVAAAAASPDLRHPLPGALPPTRIAQAALELELDGFGAISDYQLGAASTLGFVVVARPVEPAPFENRPTTNGLGDVEGTILAQAFGFDGKSRSGIVGVSTDSTAEGPSVAVGAEGQVAIGWSEESLGGDLDPRVAFFARGLAIGEAVAVLEFEEEGEQREVALAMNAAGDTVAVWTDGPATEPPGNLGRAARVGASAATGTSVVARSFDAGGIPKGDQLLIAESDATSDPGSPTVSLSDDDVVNVAFHKKNRSTGQSEGVFDRQVEKAITSGVCRPDGKTLCLGDLRFEVTASWSDTDSRSGVANARALTDDTGTFWFFDEDNIEIVLKALDACAYSDTFWVFAGGLTDVEVNLTITDVEAGTTRVYTNDLARPFEPIQDTSAFATCDPDSARRAPAELLRASAESGGCSDGALCLNQGRFEVTFEFETPKGEEGVGQPSVLTDDTGTFWFFDAANVEAVVKVLDACAVGDRYWVFAAGLTDVAATLTVTDTVTGASRTYDNPQSTPFRPVVDTDAFASCR